MQALKTLLSDPSAKSVILGIIGAALVLFGTPKEKQDQAIALASGILTLAGIYAAGKHYEQGKLNEGTIPDGSKPANELQVTLTEADSPVGPLSTSAASPGSAPPAVSLLLLPLILAGIFFGSGCTQVQHAVQGYSFTPTAQASVDFVASELGAYVAADQSLSDAARSALSAKIQKLHAIVAQSVPQPTIDEIDAAWHDIEPSYIDYVGRDPTLDAEQKEIFTGVASKFDTLLAAERSRRASVWRQ